MEWHPTKNDKLRPQDVTYASGKKIWWKCPMGEGHEWEQRVSDRTRPKKLSVDKRTGKTFVRRGSNCPVCQKFNKNQKD